MLHLLLEQTDERHYVTGADILRFWEAHDIHASRKNVYSDIQLLVDSGVDIICIKSTQNRYFIGSRLLELPELKLLVDAVESSHLITEKKSAALIEKLGHLTSRYNAALLNRPVYMEGTAKPDNEAVYYAIDAIQTAIHEQRAISFQYFEYTPKKEKVLKHKGYRYGFSPYALIWNRDFYYAVGWSEKHRKLAQFRVDRMTAIQESDAPYIADPSFDPASYLREVFGMYHDAPRRVTLLCENRTMRSVIDHFGGRMGPQRWWTPNTSGPPWMWRPPRRSFPGCSPSAALSASRSLRRYWRRCGTWPHGCIHKNKRDLSREGRADPSHLYEAGEPLRGMYPRRGPSRF